MLVRMGNDEAKCQEKNYQMWPKTISISARSCLIVEVRTVVLLVVGKTSDSRCKTSRPVRVPVGSGLSRREIPFVSEDRDKGKAQPKNPSQMDCSALRDHKKRE